MLQLGFLTLKKSEVDLSLVKEIYKSLDIEGNGVLLYNLRKFLIALLGVTELLTELKEEEGVKQNKS